MNNPFDIQFDENQVIITHCPNQRVFKHNLDVEFKTHGFKKLNGNTIIKAKLQACDFAYTLGLYDLTLNFEIIAGNKTMFHTMCLPEVFEPIKVLPNQMEKTIWALINKVNYLSVKLDEKEADVTRLNNKINLLEFDIEVLKQKDLPDW